MFTGFKSKKESSVDLYKLVITLDNRVKVKEV